MLGPTFAAGVLICRPAAIWQLRPLSQPGLTQAAGPRHDRRERALPTATTLGRDPARDGGRFRRVERLAMSTRVLAYGRTSTVLSSCLTSMPSLEPAMLTKKSSGDKRIG